MIFDIERSIEVLERTPAVLNAMLGGIGEAWTSVNEGGQTWSAYDIVGHFIHGDETDWLARAEIILSGNPDKKFVPFNRFAQFEATENKTLQQLLHEFSAVRKRNIEILHSKKITDKDFTATGIHPVFGKVLLSQLLATRVVHDLNHIAQISRVMAKQYKEAVGPWIAYLGILKT